MDKHLSETIITKYYQNDIGITFTFCYSYYSNIEYKYKNILKLINSTIITKEKRDEYINFIANYNKHVNCFINIQRKWKYSKCKKYDNEYDMTLTVPLSSYKDSELFSFVQNNTIYTFTVSDILKVIQTSLLNSEYCTEKPKKPKNPYNNLIISRTILFNLYIHCKIHNIIIPYFVNEFYKCGFWLRSFACRNNFKLSENAIKNHIYYSSTDELYEEIFNMFEYLDDEEFIANYNIAENIQLLGPHIACESYKKRMNNICKKMLEPYFMHLYKVQHDAILNTYYITLMLFYLRRNIQNYGLFWIQKVKVKRSSIQPLHGSFTQPPAFRFETDFVTSNNGFHFDISENIVPNHTFNFNTMRNNSDISSNVIADTSQNVIIDNTDTKLSEPEELNENKSDDDHVDDDKSDDDNNFDSDIGDEDKKDERSYSIHFDISDNYVDHTNYISPEMRESLLDPSASFNFGFEIPENGLYVSDVSDSLINTFGCESSSDEDSSTDSNNTVTESESSNESDDEPSNDHQPSNEVEPSSGSDDESYYSPMSLCSD